ncbi:MAG: GNAT family protein [Armatimonadota bacterium]
MIPNAFLIGEKIYLRPFEKSDLDYIRKWYNDPELRGSICVTEPYNAVKTEQWFDDICKDEQRIWFAIAVKENDEVIGECGLLRMFVAWKTTDLTMIIGERDAHGKGYGSEAIRLLLDYAFGYLGFHRVAVGVAGFNEDAVRFYEKNGFKREGIQRDGYYYNYEYHDFVMMSILEDEYRHTAS